MTVYIIGGSGSGKSEFAEKIAVSLNGERRVYIASMIPRGDEGKNKVIRHRTMRQNKGFITIEKYLDLETADIYENDCVLVECMSNLLANEMFEDNGSGEYAVENIKKGIKHISESTKNSVFVSNDVFRDGYQYDEDTEKYIKNLAEVNNYIISKADAAFEVVCGIPIVIKGDVKCLNHWQ